jgi:uncharacterized protein YjiS (DUF1127 family)
MPTAYAARGGVRQLDAALHTASPSLAARFARQLSEFLEKRRKRAEQRRLVAKLSELSDASLLDIGVAEEEIYLVRNLEPFTPRAWRDPRGCERCCGA